MSAVFWKGWGDSPTGDYVVTVTDGERKVERRIDAREQQELMWAYPYSILTKGNLQRQMLRELRGEATK